MQVGPLALMASMMLGVIMSTSSSQAQSSRFGTWWTKFETMAIAESDIVCALNFGALTTETIDGRRAVIMSNGLIIAQFAGAIEAGTLKLSMNKLDDSGGKAPLRPYAAWLRSPSGKDMADSILSSEPDDDMDTLFVVFHAKEKFRTVLREAVGAARISVLYTRSRDTLPVVLSLELDTVDPDPQGNRARSRREIDKFGKCLGSLPRR